MGGAGSGVPLLLSKCGCFLTFLVALDYWLCVTLEEEKVLERKQRASPLPISHAEPCLVCSSNYRYFAVCLHGGSTLTSSPLIIHANFSN